MYTFKPFVFTKCNYNNNNKKIKIKPSVRTFPSIFCNSKYLYSFSGYHYLPLRENGTIDFDNPKIIEEIWKLNLSTGIWTCLPNQQFLPTKKEMILGVTLIADKLIVTTWIQNYRPKSFIYICDLTNENTVVKLTTKGPIPKRLFSHKLISHGFNLYTIGTDRSLSVFKINPFVGRWEKLHPENSDDFPGRYDDVELAFDGEKIFVFHVKTCDKNLYEFKTIKAYNIEENRWYTLNTIGDPDNVQAFPTNRINFGTAQFIDSESKEEANYFIISGGIMDHKIYDDIWRLNLRTLQWTCLSKFNCILPQTTCEHDTTISSNGKMYIFGGRIKNIHHSLNGVNDLYSAWLKIPKLKDICWDAVNYYYNDLNIKTSEELYELGLPVDFVNSRSVRDSLEADGKLRCVKAEMRSEVLKLLDNSSKSSRINKCEMPSDVLLLNELIREYFDWIGYKYTLSVFISECDSKKQSLDRSLVAQSLGIEDNEGTKKLPLLFCLTETFKKLKNT